MEKWTASLLVVGDELLIGQVTDTNSVWMASALNAIGIWVRQRVAVGDQADDIRHALDWLRRDTQIVLMTGGLGPTKDDITKAMLAAYFKSEMVVDPVALANVTHIFENILKRPLTDRNRKQAEVPKACTVIQNKRGTAPGMWFEAEGSVLVSMPGVPHEMKGMMQDYVLPALRKRFPLPAISHRTLLTAGIGESFLADRLESFEDALPPQIKLAYLPNYGLVRLRLTAIGEVKDPVGSQLDNQFSKLKTLVSEWLVADEDLSLEVVIGSLLRGQQKTLATAESCTGGYLAHLITSVPGSSQYFLGSVISYANQVKEHMLDVPSEILKQRGAVSEETVKLMARGGRQKLQADFCVATSGVMGPDGGTEQNPVGTAWIAVADVNQVSAQKFFFRFDRNRNTELTAFAALNMLRKQLMSSSPIA